MGNDGGEGSGVLGGVDIRSVLTAKASKARNALLRWQQSLASSFCSHGKSLVNWEWVRKLWGRKKCGFRCGLGCLEQCVLHPELFPFPFAQPSDLELLEGAGSAHGCDGKGMISLCPAAQRASL